MTTALVDLCHSYVARRGDGVPVEVAQRHDGVDGPGWLLAVALVRSEAEERIGDTMELALAAGFRRHALGDCVAYVELAAALFAGRSVEAAAEAATGRSVPSGQGRDSTLSTGGAVQFRLTGDEAADAVRAGLWALRRPGGVADVVSALSEYAPAGVGAAVGGLLGLRDGGGSVPAHWHRRLHCSAACLALAPGLIRARHHHGVACGRTPRRRPPDIPRSPDFLRRSLVGSAS